MKCIYSGVVAAGLIGLPSVAPAIQISDYLDPQSEWEEAFLLGQFNSKSGNQEQTSYNLSVEADYEHNYSSLPRVWQLAADGATNLSRGPNRDDPAVEATLAHAHAHMDNYFHPKAAWFWFGSTDLAYQDDRHDLFTKVGTGIGYGRVINATPLAKVLRIEEELREHGLLMGRITDATYLTLAKMIDREEEFKSRYGTDEYKPYWFMALEEILHQAGLLKSGSLGAAGTLYMDRVLFDEPISTRKHGWVLRAGVGMVVQDFDGNNGDPTLDAEWEYARPYGYRGQVSNVLKYSAILTDKTGQLLSNTLKYTHEISDRIDWENTWRLLLDKPGDNETDTLTNVLSSTFRYYVTNRINVDATMTYSKIDDNIAGNGNEDADITTFFGIRYRLK